MLNKINKNMEKGNKIKIVSLKNELKEIIILNEKNKIRNDFIYIISEKNLIDFLTKEKNLLFSENVLLSKIFLKEFINKKGLLYM